MSDWIEDATKNKGALHDALNVPEDKSIPIKRLQTAIKKGGKLAKEANLAMTLRKINTGKGG
jgi:hypothetical protein